MANRSDDCNRTASPPGTPSDAGSDWDVTSGATWGCGFDIGSGQTVLYSLTADSSAGLDCGATDHSISALLIRNDNGAGVTVRRADNNNFYLFNVALDGTLSLFKRVSGSFTAIGSGSGSASLGDTLELSVVGTAITGKVNSSTLWTATDSDLSAGTQAGCRGGGSDFYDDIAITDLSGGGGGVFSWANHYYRHVAGLSA